MSINFLPWMQNWKNLIMLDLDTLLRSSDPSIKGVFFLSKCALLEEGVDTLENNSLNRCDNLSYTILGVSEGTDYDYQSHSLYRQTDLSGEQLHLNEVVKYEVPIFAIPHIAITYIEMKNWHNSQADPTPSTMWAARSIFQLFKTMREWSFMVDEPFNCDHPMAVYSKLAFEVLAPPQSIVDEIDSLPDMHLAKFLKGQEDYKMIPHPYPEVSQTFKDWVVSLQEQYRQKSFEEMIADL